MNKNFPPTRNRSDTFRVLCYNVLAESYALSERINYCPSWALAWEYRKHRILKEIASYVRFLDVLFHSPFIF